MKKLQYLVLALTTSAAINGQAASQANKADDSPMQLTTEEDVYFAQNIEAKKLVKPQKSAIQYDGEVAYMDITVSAPGELAAMVNSDFCEIDSIAIHGPIGGADFHALWSATFSDKLTAINLEDAEAENGEIPDNAFYIRSEQNEPGNITAIKLRHISLPKNVTQIGSYAFYYAAKLEEVNFPSTLKVVGEYAFANCFWTKCDGMKLPEGIEIIGNNAFFQCFEHDTGSLAMPSTLKEIGNEAFYMARIESISLPDGLERIGDMAFYMCRFIKEVKIPSTCLNLGVGAFKFNLALEYIELPDGLEYLPEDFVYDCALLGELSIPSTVKKIDENALALCEKIESLSLPDGVETVGEEAFYSMSGLKEVSFPSTLKSLGEKSCGRWSSINKIYCAAAEPPVCVLDNSGNSPFGDVAATNNEYSTPRETPVYVPIGCADKYRNANGWNYFTTFIETDNFPGEASVDEVAEDPTEDSDDAIYDLMGRKVTHPTKGQIYVRHGKKFICL